jgi:hypothetical protein
MAVKAVVIEIRSPRECTVFESWLQKSTPSILLVPLAAHCGSDVRRKASQPGKWNERRCRNRTALLDEDDRTGRIEEVLKRKAFIQTRVFCLSLTSSLPSCVSVRRIEDILGFAVEGPKPTFCLAGSWQAGLPS